MKAEHPTQMAHPLAELQAEIRRVFFVEPSAELRARTIERFRRLVRESGRPGRDQAATGTPTASR